MPGNNEITQLDSLSSALNGESVLNFQMENSKEKFLIQFLFKITKLNFIVSSRLYFPVLLLKILLHQRHHNHEIRHLLLSPRPQGQSHLIPLLINCPSLHQIPDLFNIITKKFPSAVAGCRHSDGNLESLQKRVFFGLLRGGKGLLCTAC